MEKINLTQREAAAVVAGLEELKQTDPKRYSAIHKKMSQGGKLQPLSELEIESLQSKISSAWGFSR